MTNPCRRQIKAAQTGEEGESGRRRGTLAPVHRKLTSQTDKEFKKKQADEAKARKELAAKAAKGGPLVGGGIKKCDPLSKPGLMVDRERSKSDTLSLSRKLSVAVVV